MTTPVTLPLLNPTLTPDVQLAQIIENDPVFLAARDKLDQELAEIRQRHSQSVAEHSRLTQVCLDSLVNDKKTGQKHPDGMELKVSRNYRSDLKHHFNVWFMVKVSHETTARFEVNAAASHYAGDDVMFSLVSLSYYDPAVEAGQDSDCEDDISRIAALPDLAAFESYGKAHDMAMRFIKSMLNPVSDVVSDTLREMVCALGLAQALQQQIDDYRRLYSRDIVNAWRSQYRAVSYDDFNALYNGKPGDSMAFVMVRYSSDDSRPPGFRVIMYTSYFRFALQLNDKGRQLIDLRVTGFDSLMARKLDALNKVLVEKGVPDTDLLAYFGSALRVPDELEHSVFPRNGIVINTPSR